MGSFLDEVRRKLGKNSNTRQMQRQRHEPFDDDFVTTGDVVSLLYEVELAREKISDRLAQLRLWLHRYPELNKHFTQFEHQGGISADDFVQFIAGRMSPRKVTKKKHLRLVVTNTRQRPKSLSRHRLNPTDAA